MRLIDADRLCEDLLNRWNIADTRKEELIRQVMADIVTPIVVSQPTVNQWIPVSERPPEERDSIFAKLYGTEKWRDAMFRKISDTVICTVQYRDGTRQTAPCHTIDGEWNQSMKGMGKVLAWMPLPEPYKEEEE